MPSNNAFESPVLSHSYSTASDLSGSIYSPVKLVAGELQACAAGESAIGFLQEKPDGTTPGGDVGSVMHNGVSRGVASAAIAQGDKLAAAGSGQLRVAVSGDHVLGIALSPASAAGEVLAVLVTLGGAPLP